MRAWRSLFIQKRSKSTLKRSKSRALHLRRTKQLKKGGIVVVRIFRTFKTTIRRIKINKPIFRDAITLSHLLTRSSTMTIQFTLLIRNHTPILICWTTFVWSSRSSSTTWVETLCVEPSLVTGVNTSQSQIDLLLRLIRKRKESLLQQEFILENQTARSWWKE